MSAVVNFLVNAAGTTGSGGVVGGAIDDAALPPLPLPGAATDVEQAAAAISIDANNRCGFMFVQRIIATHYCKVY